MALTLESILSYTYLTETVRVVKPGVPDVFPKEFFSVTKPIKGYRFEYIQLYGTRKLAQRVPAGAPPRAASKVELNSKQVTLYQIKNSMVFDQEMMQWLRDFASYEPMQYRCLDLLAEQGMNFRQRFENTRITSLGMFLALGKNYWDVDGNLQGVSSGSLFNFDQGIPAANIGTIADTYSTGGQIVNASWALPTTDIITQLNNLKTLAKKQGGGYDLENAFYGRNVAGYLANNQAVKNYWAYNLPRGDEILKEGRVPDGFMGMKWHPVQNAFYDTEAGTSTEYWPADQVTFYPKIDHNTYTLFEGSTMVPGYFNLATDAVAALRDGKEVTGMGRYAYWASNDYTQINDVHFDAFVPLFKVPASVFLVDTTP